MMCISASPFGMGVFAAGCSHDYENVMKNGEFEYYGCSLCGEVVDTKPVIFFANVGGDNANDGFTAKTPVATMLEAFARLAEYGMGGTAVICGQALINGNYQLEDAGDTVTVTSLYNDVDYRKTNKACLITVYSLYLNSDVVFDNVSFVVTGSLKNWYLQFNSITVTDSCDLYTNSGSYTLAKPPIAVSPTVSYCTNLITGYKSDADAAASGKSKATQKLIINGGCFNILAGSKEGGSTVGLFCHEKGPDASRNDQPAVSTGIYIGGNASVGGIDLSPVNNYTAKVYFTDGKTDLLYYDYAGGAYVKKSTISGYSADTTYLFMDTESSAEETVHVIDEYIFTAAAVQKRENPVPNPALRVPFTVSPDWVDNASAPVEEFGVLMAFESNKDKIAYQKAKGEIGGAIGKSVSYDENRNDYLYAGGDTAVTFYGVLEFDKAGYESEYFVAVPYGVVNSSAVGGKYTLLGAPVRFNYIGEEPDVPSDELDALDSLLPYDGYKLKIACIGDSITQGTGVSDKENDSYPAQLQDILGNKYVVGNFGKGGSYVLKADSKYNTGHSERPELSYTNTAEYPASLAFNPDVVVIMLGTNDMRNMLSDAAKAEFKETLKELVKSYKVLDSVKKVYLCSNIHALSSAMAVQLSSGEMTRLVKETAEAAGCGFIDVNAVTFEYMSVCMNATDDKLHPNKAGYAEIAKAICAGIRGTEADITVPAVSKSGVVYVSGNGSADTLGSTPETAINDLAMAVGLLRNSGGTVVVCGPLDIDYNTFLPDTAKRITVTSEYDGVDYRKTAEAKLSFSKSIYLGGDFTFEKVDMHVTVTNLMFVCNYHNVTIGSDVRCTVASDSVKYFVFIAGVNYGNEGVPASIGDLGGDCNIVINSDEWQYIRAGNRRQTGAYPIGRILEDASLTITVNGGTFHNGGSTAPSAATGMNSVYGTCSLIINGGSFESNICGVGRVGTNSGGFANEMAGTVNIEINGGTITGTIKAIQDETSNVTGKVNITCASAYESQLDKTDFTNVVIK